MRAYIIDELTALECKKIQAHLLELGLAGSLDGLYWMPVPPALLNAEQNAHQHSCGPHVLALELDCPNSTDFVGGESDSSGSLRLELLVRASNNLSCGCITKAIPELREHMINYLEQMLKELEVEA